MNNAKRRSQIKWCILSALLLLLYVLQTTPDVLVIKGVKPMLLIPLAVAVACFEPPFASGIFGAICGLFTDAASGYLFGFNGIILLFCCVAISLIHTNYLKSRLLDTLFSGLGVLLLQRSLDYFFYYSIWGLDPNHYLLLHRILPTAVFSFTVCIPVHYLLKFIEQKFTDDDSELKIDPSSKPKTSA